jgi:hypothetical protein
MMVGKTLSFSFGEVCNTNKGKNNMSGDTQSNYILIDMQNSELGPSWWWGNRCMYVLSFWCSIMAYLATYTDETHR